MPIVIVVCLFLHYATAMTIFGAAAFRLAIQGADADGVDARLRPILRSAWLVLAVSAVALLMANAGAMGGSWSDMIDLETIGAVLTDTSFGQVWQGHLGLIVLAGIMLWRARPSGPWITVAAMVALGSLALVGHAAMVEGWSGGLRRVNQAVHLLAGGAWIGGLCALAAALAEMRSRPQSAVKLLHRFSSYGTIALALVLATGVINAALLVGGVHGLIASVYGWTLVVKLALVAVMTAIAFRNRFQLTPQLAANPALIGSRLRRSIALEIAVGLCIVLAASLLGTLAPPGA